MGKRGLKSWKSVKKTLKPVPSKKSETGKSSSNAGHPAERKLLMKNAISPFNAVQYVQAVDLIKDLRGAGRITSDKGVTLCTLSQLYCDAVGMSALAIRALAEKQEIATVVQGVEVGHEGVVVWQSVDVYQEKVDILNSKLGLGWAIQFTQAAVLIDYLAACPNLNLNQDQKESLFALRDNFANLVEIPSYMIRAIAGKSSSNKVGGSMGSLTDLSTKELACLCNSAAGKGFPKTYWDVKHNEALAYLQAFHQGKHPYLELGYSPENANDVADAAEKRVAEIINGAIERDKLMYIYRDGTEAPNRCGDTANECNYCGCNFFHKRGQSKKFCSRSCETMYVALMM